MVKIIKGRKYDTATTKEVGSFANAGGWRDFSHYEETLYKKRTGEYFLHGQGGPMSKYAKAEGQNSWSGGSDIIPLSFDEAREWAEEHLDADEYEDEFGEVAEDDSRAALNLSLPVTLIEALRREAVEKNMTLSALVEQKLK